MPAPNDLAHYLNRIISQHSDKPKFMATVAAVVKPLADMQQVMFALQTLFDVDNATGVQLDQIGEWLNQPRRVKTPLNGVYFSVDDPTLGVDQGIIFGSYSPTTGLIDLDDDHYRMLLRAKIAINNWNGTYSDDAQGGLGVVTILSTLIQEPIGDPTKTFIFYQANEQGIAHIGLSGTLPTPLAQVLITDGYIHLAPMGVYLDYNITSVDGSPLFGVDMDNQFVSGVDVGAIGNVFN